MRVLLAFDKFKDALSAREACALAAGALRESHPEWILDLCPLADGGEGFTEILTTAVDGRIHKTMVTAPRGDRVSASFGLVNMDALPLPTRRLLGLESVLPEEATTTSHRLAIVEMAAASGLALLPADRRDPWQTTTAGTGELIAHAVASGADAVLLGVGGSATHDLGFGALQALGFAFLDAAGETVTPPVPARWVEVEKIEGRLPATFPRILIACDVANPLLGAHGAAAVYAPQKGLPAGDIERLDLASERLARLLCAHCGRPDALTKSPGAGAAGGLAFGLMVAANARLLSGSDLVARWLDLDTRVAAADIVITGEGRFDDSSLNGKGPGAVIAHARALGKPAHVFAGSLACSGSPVSDPLLALHCITPVDTPLAEALRSAPETLRRAVRQVFD